MSTPTKVICGGIKVLLWWGAGEGQAPAQASFVHHHIQEDVLRHHLHHWVQRPNCQVGTILQRLSRSDNTQTKVKFSVAVNQSIITITPRKQVTINPLLHASLPFYKSTNTYQTNNILNLVVHIIILFLDVSSSI